MAKLEAGGVLDLVALSKAESKIGDYKYSALNEAEFNAEHLGEWKLCDGRSCTGTAYAAITGQTNVPDAMSDGSFIRSRKTGRTVCSKEGQDWKGFYMANTGQSTNSYNHNQEYHGKSTTGFVGRTFAGGWSAPAAAIGTMWDNSEVRPVNIALNLYVKVNY